jgi:alkanesulfonate monooxygenase SsuD/methylene tetrahydromethanopterin reductase-like flavin-dependent oxidoreductase (luciferase family)
MRAFREAVEIVVKMWTEEKPTYQGKFYTINEPINEPKGIQTPHIPLWLGGGGEKVTLKLTAQYANIWNGFGPVENYAHKNNVLNDWCAQVGRNPADIERSITIGAGDLDNLDALAAAGATHFIMGHGHPYDLEPVAKLVAWRDARNRICSV